MEKAILFFSVGKTYGFVFLNKNMIQLINTLFKIIGGIALTLLLLRSSALAGQKPILHLLSLPDDLKEMDLPGDIILEDMNQDGRVDIIFIVKNKIYISYQNTDCTFSSFEVLISSLQGAVDFGDIFQGGEKEIIVMHEHGISCFQKLKGRWDESPISLVEKPTLYKDLSFQGLIRERFVLDIDNDGIPELMLLGPKALHFYRKNKLGIYQLRQTLPIETSIYRGFLGIRVSHGPIDWLVRNKKKILSGKEWPVAAHYLTWSEEFSWPSFMIGDFNQDSKKDFAWIQPKQIIKMEGIQTTYEYRVHYFDENNIFSSEAGRIIHDIHGAWLSPNCTDIDGDGHLDFLRYQIKYKSQLLQRPRIQFELFLAKDDGTYPETPFQILETSSYPIGADLLTDITGDGRKELVLIHLERRGFSIANIIRQYVEKGINAEVRILPFRQGEGFSQQEAIRKKIDISFITGVPVSLAADFNGDGAKDMIVVSRDHLRIYPFLIGKNEFSNQPWLNVKIPPNGFPLVKEIEGEQKSIVILFYSDKIGIFRIN